MKTKIHGLGFGGWLALIFITLKLCKVIAWSWWWVLSPFWIPLAIALTVAGALLAFSGIIALIAWNIQRKARK